MYKKDNHNLGKKGDERRDLHFAVAYFFIYIKYINHTFIYIFIF